MTMLIFILVILVPDDIHGTLDISSNGELLKGNTISIACSVSTFSGTAGWINPSISSVAIHTCTSAFCLPTNVLYPRYTFSSSANTFTINITNVELGDEEWTCEHSLGPESKTVSLGLKVAPTTCTLVESGGIYTCTSSCGYPANDMSIRAKLNGTSNTQDLTSLTNVSAPACTSPESAYSANVPTSFFTKSTDLYCECGVSGFESTFVQSNAVAVTAISSSCGSCTPTNVLAALDIVVAVVCVALCWKVYFKFSESGGGKGKFKCSVTWCFRATIIATVVFVIGFILCIAGLIICVTCDDSVSSSNSVTVGFALAVVGFVLAAVTLVIVIILVILFCRGVITKKDDGQTINHVSVKNNDPLTLTCLAGDLATTLTWTGPGGILYVTGTTVQAGLSDTIKSRISASHTKGSYKLTFTEFRSSDKGTYTSTVDETVVKHEVIVQDNKAVRARPDGQDAKPRTERTPRSAGSPTSASNIKTKWRNNQVSDSNESDGSNDTPRRKLEAVPPGRKLPALGLVDASQKANPLEPIEVNETKKLKKKKKRRSKEERAQVDGEY